jgi:hypothetical protein
MEVDRTGVPDLFVEIRSRPITLNPKNKVLESNLFWYLATGSTLLEKLSTFVVVHVNKLMRAQGSHITQEKTELRNPERIF